MLKDSEEQSTKVGYCTRMMLRLVVIWGQMHRQNEAIQKIHWLALFFDFRPPLLTLTGPSTCYYPR